MDVAVLAVNLTAQSSANAVAPVNPVSGEAGALGVKDSADLFAALLAQQIGQDFLSGRADAVGVKTAPVLKKELDEDVTALSPANPAGVVQIDPSLLIQQAAQSVQGQVSGQVMVDRTGIADEDDAGDDAVSLGRIAADSSGPGRAMAGSVAKNELPRQPIAEGSASFAAQPMAERSVQAADAARIEAPVPQVVQMKGSGPVMPEASSGEKVSEPKLPVPELSAHSMEQAPVPSAGALQVNTFVNTAVSQSSSSQPVSNIPQVVGHSVWGEALGNRVVWMVGQNHQGVELHLNPPSLGPLEVRLSMSDGQANLSFSTQHLPVKEAIDAATPRLREMLGESGISLGSVSVNVGSFTQQAPHDQAQTSTRQSFMPEWAAAANTATLLTTPVSHSGRNGLVDTFA